jgi:flagellar L-ring protein precursor FlgH
MKATAIFLFIVLSAHAAAAQGSNPSLYSEASPNLYLFRDLKARNVNDIITISVIESSTASNSANTSTQKKGDVSLAAPSLFGIKTPATLLQASSGLDFAGQGATTRTGQLSASISARITQVLPSGDLAIEGTKQVTINGEHQVLKVRGVVRQYDIASNNVILSTAIANMEVVFDGKGVISDANKPALLSRIFKYILPF